MFEIKVDNKNEFNWTHFAVVNQRRQSVGNCSRVFIFYFERAFESILGIKKNTYCKAWAHRLIHESGEPTNLKDRFCKWHFTKVIDTFT